jgi:hypothetical protein
MSLMMIRTGIKSANETQYNVLLCYYAYFTDYRKNPGRRAPESITTPGGSAENHDRAASAAPNALNQIFGGFDFARMITGELEHFQNRITIWQTASEEEWKQGGEGMTSRATLSSGED